MDPEAGVERGARGLSGQESTQPNVAMAVVDDLGWANVGWHAKDSECALCQAVATADRPLSFAVITPHSDALVKEGLELDRHYVFMFCSPTRMSIMSGRLPYHVNQVNLATWARDWSMPGEMTALPAKLKQVG